MKKLEIIICAAIKIEETGEINYISFRDNSEQQG